ncbi:MAG TPA: SRPBCC family protein [Thermoleophilaceae bacterium]
MSPIDVSTSIDIDRPADEVFAFVSEFPNNPRWQGGQRSCEWTSEPPLRVGSAYDQHARFLGKDMTNSFRVVEHDPERRVKFTSTGGSFPITVTRTVEPLDHSRSRFTEHVQGEPGRFFRIAEPILRRLVRRSIRRDFPRLKALLEDRS